MATTASLKAMMSPAKKALFDLVKEGKARLEPECSILTTAIKVDPSHFQARSQAINIGHVHDISEVFKDVDLAPAIPPIVVFEIHDGGYVRRWLVDGFHRVKAARKVGMTSLPAYIVKGDMWDAIQFAVMANVDNTALPLKPADKRKAIRMMFANPAGWMMSDRQIAIRCGLSHVTVSKYRIEWSLEKKIAISDEMMVRRTSSSVPFLSKRRKSNVFSASDIPAVKPFQGDGRLSGAFSLVKAKGIDQADFTACVGDNRHLSEWLRSKGVAAKSAQTNTSIIGGISVPGARCIALHPPTQSSIVHGIGLLVLMAKESREDVRRIVICYKGLANSRGKAVMNLGSLQPFPVEFMTPEEIVAEFGPKAGDDEGTPTINQ